ncbi:recombinase family protein [Paeniglutamicibacter sp. NPDC012692]|uniref:recombinase family protein n=1 Tax=Paeniglutamicibacter sp. NPDC012692 TaxID=3364388 RepID=UPI0036AC09A3
MVKVAAIYARISRDKKLHTEDEGASVASQIKACQEFIASKGWTQGEVYQDNSISATSGAERPAFERLLTDAPPLVVAFKQDRLSRDVMDTLRIKAAGITGHMCDGGKLDFSSSDAGMITMFRSVIDAAEGEKKSERQKLANQRIADSGQYRGSIRPFGQERSGDWVPGEAEAVVEAAEKLVSGEWSFYRVSEVWNLQGLKTPQTGKQGGKQWTSGTVRNYFTRPRLYGVQDYEGKLYPLKNWKPLLTEDQFNAIQVKIESQRTGKRSTSITRHDVRLLTGIVSCAECSRGMNAGQRGGAGSTRCYKCPTTKHVTMVAEPLERAISTHALELLGQHKEIRTQQEGTTRRLAEIEGERLRLNTEHDEWITEAVEAGLRPNVIAAKEARYEKSISELDDERLTLKQDQTVSIFEGYNLEGWEASPTAMRRDLLTSVFKKIEISRGKQGQRFNPDVISYEYTPLGRRLYDDWAEANTVNPWKLKEGSASSREPVESRIQRIKANKTTLEDWIGNAPQPKA